MVRVFLLGSKEHLKDLNLSTATGKKTQMAEAGVSSS